MSSALLWIAVSGAVGRVAAETPCAAQDPGEPECLLRWAESSGDYALVTQHLEARLAATEAPDGGRDALALAELALIEGDFERLRVRAVDALRRCLFAAERDCELRARHLNVYGLSQTNRLGEAIWEAEKAHLLAARSGTPAERFKFAVTLARLRLSGLVDLGRALRLLDEIEPLAAEADPGDRLYALSTRAGLLDHLGYLERAAVSYAQVRDLALAQGNQLIRASEEFNRVDSLAKSGSLSRSRSQLEAAVTALRVLTDHPQTPVSTRLRALALLAQLDPGGAPAYLSDCLQTATAIDDPRNIARCAAELAKVSLDSSSEDGPSPDELIELARRAAARSSNPNADLEVSQAQTALLWSSVPAEEALTESMQLLAAEVRRRDRQASPARQFEFLGFLNEDHYALASRIAAAVSAGRLPADRLEQALGLLESVRGGLGHPLRPEAPVENRLRVWWRAAAAVRDPGHRPPDLSLAFAQVEAMPEHSAAAERQSPADIPRLDLAAVRRTLAPGEAILYFQWLPGSDALWIYALSRHAIAVRRLQNPGAIELALARLDSSVRHRHGVEFGQVLAQLYRALLAPSLAELASVERLIVVPDAALYSVPMQALKRVDSRLLEIEVFPSIAAWMSRDRGRMGDRTVRIFANPVLPREARGSARGDLALEPLPSAEHEAAAVVHLLGRRARVAHGSAATETAALAALSSAAGVVHFATHALLDPGNPQASAVVLAADADNDGWLTLGQIATLDIPPKLIVLSACEAASGRMLTGEGLIGLSSALLAAGAGAVLANLWPIDDAQAAAFIERTYVYLNLGKPLGAAVSAAGADLEAAGYPPTAWAGWTVIGDSSGTLAAPPRRWIWALALGMVPLMLAVAVYPRRRR